MSPTGEQWAKYGMTEELYVYNTIADEAANAKAKSIQRKEGDQLQDSHTIEKAYFIALRIAMIEARCWKEKDKYQAAKATSTTRIVKAREEKLRQKYEVATQAITNKHQTYSLGEWTRCRHCTRRCLTKERTHLLGQAPVRQADHE